MKITTTKCFKRARDGFTLVELLIVIIIIAILAGMMMMTSASATDRATATKIISDLRAMKSAALLYYMDHKEWPGVSDAAGKEGNTQPAAQARYNKSLSKYMDRSLDERYVGVWIYDTDGKDYIGIRMYDSDFGVGVKKILEESARDAGIYGCTGRTIKYFNAEVNDHVYMNLR